MIISHSGGQNTAGAGFPDETTDWENNYSVYDYVRLYQLPVKNSNINKALRIREGRNGTNRNSPVSVYKL